MNIIRSNDIELSVSEIGAEIKSLKINGLEYMWNKEIIWAKTSPILFPFIGSSKDDKYIHNGKTYKMQKHGFCREANFELIENKSNKLVYKYTNDSEIEKIYPFNFDFLVSYEILDDKTVEMEFNILNKGMDTMYFSVGGHPAFYLGENVENYSIVVDKEKIKTMKLKGPFIDNDKYIEISNTNDFLVSDELFTNIDTIILEDVNSSSIYKGNKKVLEVITENCPYTAYWRPKKSNFICIEPWYGIPDEFDTTHILKEKKGIQELEAGKIFKASIIMKFEK